MGEKIVLQDEKVQPTYTFHIARLLRLHSFGGVCEVAMTKAPASDLMQD